MGEGHVFGAVVCLALTLELSVSCDEGPGRLSSGTGPGGRSPLDFQTALDRGSNGFPGMAGPNLGFNDFPRGTGFNPRSGPGLGPGLRPGFNGAVPGPAGVSGAGRPLARTRRGMDSSNYLQPPSPDCYNPPVVCETHYVPVTECSPPTPPSWNGPEYETWDLTESGPWQRQVARRRRDVKGILDEIKEKKDKLVEDKKVDEKEEIPTTHPVPAGETTINNNYYYFDINPPEKTEEVIHVVPAEHPPPPPHQGCGNGFVERRPGGWGRF